MTIELTELRPINLIIFPDWNQPELDLYQDLSLVLKTILTHPDQNWMSLLIDSSSLPEGSQIDPPLILSDVFMNLLLEEDWEIDQEPTIIFLENLTLSDWEDLRPHLHYYIQLTGENEELLQELHPESSLPEISLEILSPEHLILSPESLKNCGLITYSQGDFLTTIQYYQKLQELQGGDPQTYLILADSFRQLQDPHQGIKILQEGVNHFPQSGQLQFELVKCLHLNGQTQTAIHQAELASQLLPQEYVFKLFKHLLLPIVYDTPEEFEFYRQRFVQELDLLIDETDLEQPEIPLQAQRGFASFTNFYLPYQAYNIREVQSKYAQLIHEVMKANYPQWSQHLSLPPLAENGKIRVGYLSSFLHSYSGTLWLTGWLKYASQEKFEIYCYYTGNDPDLVTERFREYSDVFHHIPHDLEAVCEQVIKDNLHILVYPEIGMDAMTILIASLRLAPLQCVAWGHPVTSGLPTLDYFISSELMEPENAQDHYSETLIRLPNIGVSYPKPPIGTLNKTRADFNLSEDRVIYFCCQAPFKYLPQYDYIFAEISQRVPQALFIFPRGESLQPRLKRAFTKVGLKSEDYCQVLPLKTREDYMAMNFLSDVFLDTITWSGGNTSLEAIACSLPIVTYGGEFMRGLHAYSFLKMLGVTDTIANSETDYIDLAVQLALNPKWRQEIKQKITEKIDRLFDDRVCVLALEQFYQSLVSC